MRWRSLPVGLGACGGLRDVKTTAQAVRAIINLWGIMDTMIAVIITGTAGAAEAPAHRSRFWMIPAPRRWWTGLDSNQRTLTRADLQSAAFNHSATCPWDRRSEGGPMPPRAVHVHAPKIGRAPV